MIGEGFVKVWQCCCEKCDFKKIKKEIQNDPDGAKFFQKEQTIFKEMDFHLAMDLNKFNFILKVINNEYTEIKNFFINH